MDGGELLTVGEYPSLSGQIGVEYFVNVTSLDVQSQPTRVVQLRVLVSRENRSPPRFIRTSPIVLEGNDGCFSADAYRYAVGDTPLRMRQTISISDDDVDDYNRAVTFSLDHRGGRRRSRWRRLPDLNARYVSIDPITGHLSSGLVLRASPTSLVHISVVAANSVASPALTSRVGVSVFVCDFPGEKSHICMNQLMQYACNDLSD